MRALIFIESNTTGTGELFIKKALRRGLATYFLTANRAKYPFLDALPVTVVSIDTTDAAEIALFCAALDGVAGVFSSSEFFIEVASEVATALKLHTGNTTAIRTCRDKRALGDVLGARGVSAPVSIHLPLWEMAPDMLAKLPYPLVIKPRTGSGSVNVKLIADAAAAASHCDKMREDGQLHALAQQYVEGSEYSVETLTIKGETRVIAVIKKYLGAEPEFVETGHSYPAGLSAEQRELVEDCVVRALDAVGFQFGPAHTELRLHGSKVTIIEINPRLAGGLIPLLLDAVFDSDILDYILDVWIGAPAFQDFTPKRYGAIRFAMASEPGVLTAPIGLPAELRDHPELKYFHVMKQRGEQIALEGDFRDRVAAIICAGDQRERIEALAERAAAGIVLEIDSHPRPTPGRGAGLPLKLQEIVYGGAQGDDQLAVELGYLFDLNEAHLIMLGETGLVSAGKTRRLLQAHQELRASNFAALRKLPRPRGLYLMLEQHLIDTLGEETGGVLQTGRSRNDLNATVTKLKLRSASADVFGALSGLRNSLIFMASREVDQAFPIYSQYQPALPGTVAHQLLAFEQALAGECDALLHAIAEINICPLGAGAGGGTTLPIDPELVSKLLGFGRPASNSLDAVANRSAVVHFLSGMNAIAVLLSRLAQDLQLWSTVEFAFVAFPDALCGGSSMLPQKRNPFLIEFIKSRASIPVGALVSCSAVISKTPYTNSFEVGSQINGFIADSARAVCDILAVATALVDGLQVDPVRVEHHLKHTAVASTAVTETIARQQALSFRAAHTKVGQLIRSKLENCESTYEALRELDEPFISQRPMAWALSHGFGGGPGSATLATGVARACNGQAEAGEKFRQLDTVWHEAREMRRAAIEHIINEAT